MWLIIDMYKEFINGFRGIVYNTSSDDFINFLESKNTC